MVTEWVELFDHVDERTNREVLPSGRDRESTGSQSRPDLYGARLLPKQKNGFQTVSLCPKRNNWQVGYYLTETRSPRQTTFVISHGQTIPAVTRSKDFQA